ncbi:class C sortase [Eubacterium sp.]|uniref:class C sortase n=1 Tax=Eubacterium sp. TaxID=142586 RepID=UPI0026DF6CAA|nr:class C sortase [Eubacterium sp.]MDO5433016.1 class C sortase [Eubacterium sp.]
MAGTRERTEKDNRRKKRKWIYLLPALLFLIGAGLLLYPHITDWLYQNEVQEQKKIFVKQGEFEELYRELRRRNEKLYAEKQKDLVDPWSYEQPGIDLTEYGLADNIIGFLKIPKMDVELPILLGANQENMAKGAVHLTETSYPIGGTNTNSIIAAHRGYAKTAMFRDIEALEVGDEVILKNFRETLYYKVSEFRVILPTDIDQCSIQEGRDLLTLITCHPYRHNYQRYMVFCERISAEK